MPAKSWSETLSQQQQDDLYQVYLALYKSSLSINNKQRSFEAAIDGAHSWSINEATEDALKHLCETGTCDGLQRAHRVKRKDRAIKMFEDRDFPFEQKDLFEYFFSLDAVVLATKKENGTHGDQHFSTVYTIPTGVFSIPGMKAVAKAPELEWATGQLTKANIAFTAFVPPPRLRRRRAQ